MQQLTQAEIDKHNESVVITSSEAPCFICSVCQSIVSYSNSFSNKRKQLICSQCAQREADSAKMSLIEYVMTSIHGVNIKQN